MVKGTATHLALRVGLFANRPALGAMGPVAKEAVESSYASGQVFYNGARRCSWFPDEEGTETPPPALLPTTVIPCCSWFPDEEGTETRLGITPVSRPGTTLQLVPR